MRCDGGAAAVDGFTLVCAGYRSAAAHAGAAQAAGRLAFTIGAQLVAEFDDVDLIESWEATQELSPAEANELSESAAAHLMELLDAGLSAADLAEAVTDAAVVFLIAMKRQGIADPKRIPACAVTWNGSAAREKVVFSA